MGADANSLVNRHHIGQLSARTDQSVTDKDPFDFSTKNTANTSAAADEVRRHEEELAKLKQIGAKTPILPSEIGTDFDFKREIVWFNLIGFIVLHICSAVGFVMIVTNVCYLKTTLYSLALVYGSGLGVTMGAHRLWSHRSYKATTSLKVFLLWLHTLAGQNCLYVWVRDHRQHHKYSDTDADPHNANRGFFFSHIGWLMSRKHPKVIEYGRKIDMSDLEADKWIMFQKNHYKVLYMIFSFFLPTAVPVYFWNEDPIIALFTCFFCRTVTQLNATWLVNSAAHLYGTRPYDKNIFPVESMFVALFAVGEGWHNYHHAFPWDYRASELGTPLNMTGTIIDFLAKFGLVYDRKEASHGMVKHRVDRRGDGSHKNYGTDEGRSAVQTWFNIWRHPTNPTYTSLHRPTPNINYSGVPAHSHHHHHHHAEHPHPDDIDQQVEASSSNTQTEKPSAAESESNRPSNQYIVEKAESSSCTLIDKLSKFISQDVSAVCGNSSSLPAMCNNNHVAMDKSELNADEAFMVKI